MLQIRSLSELDSLSATGSVKESAAHRRIPSRELDWNDFAPSSRAYFGRKNVYPKSTKKHCLLEDLARDRHGSCDRWRRYRPEYGLSSSAQEG